MILAAERIHIPIVMNTSGKVAINNPMQAKLWTHH